MNLPARIFTTFFAAAIWLYLGSSIALSQAPPAFSHPSGFYSEPFQLELTTDDPGAVIRYELNGSEPGLQSPIYSGPIPIESKTAEGPRLSTIPTNPPGAPADWMWKEPDGNVRRGMVLRAIAEYHDGEVSDVVTATYLFVSDDEPAYTLPVVSIVTDSLSLFDHHTGIYIPGRTHQLNPSWSWWWGTGNYFNRGIEWERPAHFTLIETDGSVAVSQDVGIRIHGGGSRAMPQKSIRIYARNSYSTRTIPYRVFPDRPFDEYRRLILRNNGQGFMRGVLRDGVMHELVRDLDLETQAFRSATVFINGEYWGIQNIRERLDRHYLARRHDLNPDEIEILEFYGAPKEGSPDHYLNLLDYLDRTDMSAPGVFEYVDTQMDVQNYATYKAAQIYAVNLDWPGNNIEYWRPAAPDGRWRWLFYDFDYTLGEGASSHDFDMLQWVSADDSDHYANLPQATFLFRRLIANEDFRNLFINTVADQLNSVFRPDRVISVVDSLHAVIEPYIDEHIRRWRWPAERFMWNGELGIVRTFAEHRPAALREHVVSFFDLPGTARLTVNTSAAEGGNVSVNSIYLPGPALPWEGEYFQDVPITIAARTHRGFRLAKWEVDGPIALADTVSLSRSVGDTLVLSMRGDVSVRAVFEPLVQPHPIASGPYVFSSWPEHAPPGSYPPNMVFLQAEAQDPELHVEPEEAWTLSYDRDNRSRVVGLGDDGFAFINTSNPQADGGGYLGAALLALDATDVQDVVVNWTGGTVRPNNRKYAVRLQYRVGRDESFHDATFDDGTLVEYIRNDSAGHAQHFGPVLLPSRVNNQPYIELRWKYYYIDTGVSGPRAMLRVDDIGVAQRPSRPEILYPEPGSHRHPTDVALTWEPARGVQSYSMQLSTDPNFTSVLKDTNGIEQTQFQVTGLQNDTRYYWRVRGENIVTSGSWSIPGAFSTVPEGVTMAPNYPNPFNESTRITFTLPEGRHVKLEVFDVMGRVVAVLLDRSFDAGEYEIEWSGSGLSSGTYLVRLRSGGSTLTHQMLLLR